MFKQKRIKIHSQFSLSCTYIFFVRKKQNKIKWIDRKNQIFALTLTGYRNWKKTKNVLRQFFLNCHREITFAEVMHGAESQRSIEWIESSTIGTYRAFHRFGQAKFPDGGSVLGSSQFFILPEAATKNTARFKRGQNWPKNNHLASLIYIRNILCMTLSWKSTAVCHIVPYCPF